LSIVVATLLAFQQPPPPPQDTTKRDTTKVKLDSLPLKTTRTVSFETSEATWMSLDVSPDGKTIVFELLGDLYTMPVTGGTATRITSGPAFDSQPRWSPDGKRIVFLTDRSGAENVWLCDPDGSHSKALTKGTNNLFASPEWTPEGNYIVVSRTSGVLGSVYELWLIHKDGGTGAAMLRVQAGPNAPPPMNTLGAAFGKDPRYIWVSRHRGGFGYNLEYPLWELAMYDRQTGRLFTQTDTYGSGMRPALSSDGKWLVYATRHDAETRLRPRDLARGDEKSLVYPVTRDDQEPRLTRDSAFFDTPVWSPDGARIVVVKGPRAPRTELHVGPGYEIDWVPAAGGALTRISPINNWGRPHFSRDPNRIYVYEGPEGLV